MSISISNRAINIISIAGLILSLGFCVYGFSTGLFQDMEALTATVAKAGFWGPLIFILLQLVQVIIPIIPGGITCAAGVLLFGPLWGFLYNYVGICAGSMINFLFVRHYGPSFLRSMVSEKTYTKCESRINKGKGFDKFFAAAVFLPGAPDDLLCGLAGLTKMSFRKFALIILLGKPASIFLYSLALLGIGGWLTAALAQG